jgi:hypothetical protein
MLSFDLFSLFVHVFVNIIILSPVLWLAESPHHIGIGRHLLRRNRHHAWAIRNYVDNVVVVKSEFFELFIVRLKAPFIFLIFRNATCL